MGEVGCGRIGVKCWVAGEVGRIFVGKFSSKVFATAWGWVVFLTFADPTRT